MTDYVLVHGAWAGGWSHEGLAQDLRALGHRAVVVHLKGLGIRRDEAHPGITLTDHIDDVCAAVDEAGLDRFVLVGHSYGGMVVTGAATRLGARIDTIVYLDAFLPEDGQSLWDITGEYEHHWYIDSQKHKPGYVDPIGAIDFNMVPGVVGYHPLLTLLEGVKLSGDEKLIPKKSYIFATAYNPTPFPPFAAKAKAAGWDYHEAPCDHFVMQNQPEITVRGLLGLAG